jgi:hypothetical protein
MINDLSDNRYRLYYNLDGSPRYYTMEDLPGDFIQVDHATFEAGRYDVVIRNGKLKSLSEIGQSKYHSVTLATNSTVACDPDDILIVSVNHDAKLWDYKTLE